MPRRENPRVTKALNNLKVFDGVKAIKIHGSIWQERGTGDIVACSNGQFIIAEMKTEIGKLSAVQTRRLTEWYNAGAKCIVSTDAKQVTELIATGRGNWSPYDFRAGPVTLSDE